MKTPVVITAVWLRRIDGEAQVLLEMDGKWRRVITEPIDSNFSWIAEGNGWLGWPVDDISDEVPEGERPWEWDHTPDDA